MTGLARAAARFFLPSLCLACRTRPTEELFRGGVCADCWRGVPVPEAARCGRCDEALPGSPGGARCGRCLLDPPDFERLRAAAPYRGSARRILLAFKFQGADYLGARLAGLMAQRLGRADVDEVAAVPATFRARRARGYHPAEVLAAALARRLALPFAAGRLVKARETEIQSRLPAAARAGNVRGAFAVRGTPAPARPARRRRGHVGRDRARVRAPPGARRRAAPSPSGASRAPRAPTSTVDRSGGRVNPLNRLVVRTLPLVPKAVVRRIASRYVAGETLDEALALRAQPERRGLHGDARRARRGRHARWTRPRRPSSAYERALADDRRARASTRNISVKLTALGLKLDPARLPQAVRPHRRRRRERHGIFVRIDMEDSSVTEETIRIFLETRRALREGRHRPAGLPAPQRARTRARIAAVGGNVRVCKGIYVEPPSIAFQDREEIRRQLRRARRAAALGGLLRRHRDARSGARRAHARGRSRRLRLPREAYEFQMLLGVAGDLRRRLVADGHRLRVYVPYGDAWYAYSVRRLKENPSIAGHVVKGLFLGN